MKNNKSMIYRLFVMLNSFQHPMRFRNKFGITGNVKANNGFTLIELLIYMGIMTILLTVLTQTFTSILDAQLESQSTSAVQQDGRFILARLSYDIHRVQNQDIVSPSSLGQQTTSLQLTINGVNYAYSLNNGNLQLVNNLGTNNLNSSETTISSLTFKRLGNNSSATLLSPKNTLQIKYTVTSKVIRPNGPETKDFQTTIGIR